jgi:hypothetical protein
VGVGVGVGGRSMRGGDREGVCVCVCVGAVGAVAAVGAVSVSMICNRTWRFFIHMRSERGELCDRKPRRWAPAAEAGKAGLSPNYLTLSNLPLALQLLGARGTYEGHSQRIRDKFCAHFPSNPSHSALHRSHRSKGSLRGGIPRPASTPPTAHP